MPAVSHIILLLKVGKSMNYKLKISLLTSETEERREHRGSNYLRC